MKNLNNFISTYDDLNALQKIKNPERFLFLKSRVLYFPKTYVNRQKNTQIVVSML